MEKKLYRDMEHKMLLGVAAGIGKYFNVDPTIIRIGWVILGFAFGMGLLAYLLCAIIIPQAPAGY